MKKILKWFYQKQWGTYYSGRGYLQGIGIDISAEYTQILGIRFISDITCAVNQEWLRELKRRWKEDEEQQLKEINKLK